MPMTKREALSWLDQSADATGECDQCHKDDQALYTLPQELDLEPGAGWMFCRACFRKIVTKLL